MNKPFPYRTPLAILLAALFCTSLPAGAAPLPKPDRGSVPDSKLYDYGVMGPPATDAIVVAANAAVATAMPAGPFAANWDSIAQHYRTPAWFDDAKFGIFMHWGLFSVAAHRNEWYEKHMYGAEQAWHTEHYGAPDKFGYKDFIPMLTEEKFEPDAWAALFKQSGARFVMPSAQHHDNFAMWDSAVTPFNAKNMGPKRDLLGELAVAVRKAGLKFGVGNHGVENFTFINPSSELSATMAATKSDLYDPKWGDFYNVADRSPEAMTRFLSDWLRRNFELIDKYQPDLVWFDNGANLRVLDPLKLRVAAYYYNRAKSWGKDVSLSTKYVAYAPSNDDSKQVGSIIDFEKIGTRSPAGIRPAPWMVDDAIGSTWGYTTGMKVMSGETIVRRIADTVSKNGVYVLNVSPRADGTFPDDQKATLRAVGAWLAINGEAIYGTHAWTQFGEKDWRFTVRDGALYAIGPAGSLSAPIAALARAIGKIEKVELLGGGALAFTQDEHGLKVKPADTAAAPFLALKITGLALK